MHLTLEEFQQLCVKTLVANDTARTNAEHVAHALTAAEADGIRSHGASRLPAYAAQARSGKISGHAEPALRRCATAALHIDAQNGFAYPALSLAIEELTTLTKESGIAAAAISRSHHFGVAGYHVERIAQRGMVGMLFGNSPKAIAPWGGTQPLFGTNPIAFAVPRHEQSPMVIDLSLSKVARGKIMVAAQRGESIPDDWALDESGVPTTDAQHALRGAMLPMGDAKGYALVLMVEILAAALTGSNFGFEASSFFDAQGAPPGVGQFLISIDPVAMSNGQFAQRMTALFNEIAKQPGTRLPGERRLQLRERTQRNGIDIDSELYQRIVTLF